MKPNLFIRRTIQVVVPSLTIAGPTFAKFAASVAALMGFSSLNQGDPSPKYGVVWPNLAINIADPATTTPGITIANQALVPQAFQFVNGSVSVSLAGVRYTDNVVTDFFDVSGAIWPRILGENILPNLVLNSPNMVAAPGYAATFSPNNSVMRLGSFNAPGHSHGIILTIDAEQGIPCAGIDATCVLNKADEALDNTLQGIIATFGAHTCLAIGATVDMNIGLFIDPAKIANTQNAAGDLYITIPAPCNEVLFIAENNVTPTGAISRQSSNGDRTGSLGWVAFPLSYLKTASVNANVSLPLAADVRMTDAISNGVNTWPFAANYNIRASLNPISSDIPTIPWATLVPVASDAGPL